MKIKKSTVMILIYVVIMALAVTVVLIFTISRHKEDEVIKVGFITSGNVDDLGWTSVNYRSVKLACENMGVELLTVSGVDGQNGQCIFAVDELVSKGAGMIILNSSDLADQIKDILVNYPQIVFYGANADYEAPNLSAYSSRMYQVRYLSGIIAGHYTKTGKIGFVAAEKETSAYRGINAFTLGVRSAAPDAEVIVAWTDSWEDKERETALAKALIEEENVDLLTYHQYMPYTVEVAEQYGIASIGYYETVENASDKYLTCAMCDWTAVFEKMLRKYMSGQGNATRWEWIGVESGAISLTPFSPLVSDEAAEAAERAKERLKSGWHVFSGEIKDNEGNERCAHGESMSDQVLLYEMDWLVEGVREYDK